MSYFSTLLMLSLVYPDPYQLVSFHKVDSIIYLIPNKNGIYDAKSAITLDGKNTSGGVTENPNDLMDFSIEISSPFPLSLHIVSNAKNPNICEKINFKHQGNKISALPVSDIELETATSCNYDIFNEDGKKINTFNVLLNYSFKFWCDSKITSAANKSATIIAPLCTLDPEIKNLEFTETHLKDFSPITGFHKLQSITISNSKVTTFPLGIFDNFDELYELYLANNENLTLTPGIFDNLFNLRNLVLSHNNLSYFPNGVFDKLINLSYLDLNTNKIENLSVDTFNKLVNLFYLDLSYNNLAKSNLIDTFYHLNKLKILHLSSNNFSIFPYEAFDGLNNLDTLYFEDNYISNLPGDSFMHLNNLRRLNLFGNRITNLTIHTFDKLKSLESLDIRNNQIKCLPDGIFSGNKALINLNFYDYDLEKSVNNFSNDIFTYKKC